MGSLKQLCKLMCVYWSKIIKYLQCLLPEVSAVIKGLTVSNYLSL